VERGKEEGGEEAGYDASNFLLWTIVLLPPSKSGVHDGDAGVISPEFLTV
jgi:hypothetical protein